MSTTDTLTLDVSSTARVPFGRLVTVELRKMTDTRAGRVLLMVTAGLLALLFGLVLLIVALTDSGRPSASDWINILSIPVSMLVPVLAITIVTQEWGQRTAVVTFALEPSRLRIVLAKLIAVIALGVLTVLFALLLGVVGTPLGASLAGEAADWNATAGDVGWTLLTQVLYLLMGFGFGLLLLNSPAAVAVYYVYVWILEGGVIAPGILYVLWIAFDWGQSLIPWISMRIALLPFQLGGDEGDFSGLDVDLGTDGLAIARLVVSILIWVGVPLLLGTLRVLRAELK